MSVEESSRKGEQLAAAPPPPPPTPTPPPPPLPSSSSEDTTATRKSPEKLAEVVATDKPEDKCEKKMMLLEYPSQHVPFMESRKRDARTAFEDSVYPLSPSSVDSGHSVSSWHGYGDFVPNVLVQQQQHQQQQQQVQQQQQYDWRLEQELKRLNYEHQQQHAVVVHRQVLTDDNEEPLRKQRAIQSTGASVPNQGWFCLFLF